jgi:hypothetical protein
MKKARVRRVPRPRPKRAVKQVNARSERHKLNTLSRRQLERAVKAMHASVAMTITHAEVLLKASEAIGESAVAWHKRHLVDSLAGTGILGALDRAMSTSSELREEANFRELFVDWIRLELGVESLYEPGESVELPRRALSELTVDGEVDGGFPDLLQVRVLQSGWSINGKALIKPVVKCLPKD